MLCYFTLQQLILNCNNYSIRNHIRHTFNSNLSLHVIDYFLSFFFILRYLFKIPWSIPLKKILLTQLCKFVRRKETKKRNTER